MLDRSISQAALKKNDLVPTNFAHVHESVELRDEQEGHEQQTGNADHAAGVCRDLD